MKIQFTMTLSDETVKAFAQVHDATTGRDIAGMCKEKLKELVDETKGQYDPEEDDFDDEDGDEDGDEA